VSHSLLVLLDLDGTIIDSAPGIVAGMRRAFAEVGDEVPDDEVLRSWIGPPVLHMLERELGARGPDVVARANGAFREYFDTTGAHETTVFPGMADALAGMHGDGAGAVVVTHKPLPLAQVALAEHDLDHLVRSIHAPPSASTWVPKEELFAAALSAFQAYAVVAAGDRGGDVVAAAVHGVPSVGVTWGYGTADELREAGAACLASSAEELVTMLHRTAAPPC
jgi:phosphoglycolate phosphatase